jgi:transposase
MTESDPARREQMRRSLDYMGLTPGDRLEDIEADLVPWIVAASQSLIASFASGITKDIAAVHAALVQPWSNGQTEGHITKLKLVKRQMYGRAKIDLLQARLIGAT